ncbi:hypothetical protein lerEdw1_005000 [Lerista edwardsae]|nr:hypothetical protein lerEdw1_005000 [Lerista edwardsae]
MESFPVQALLNAPVCFPFIHRGLCQVAFPGVGGGTRSAPLDSPLPLCGLMRFRCCVFGMANQIPPIRLVI